MSDWNRGREEELRRYRDEERAWSARDRRGDYDIGREGRSFEDRNRPEWREPQRGRFGAARHGLGYGQAAGTQDYPARSYRADEPRGQGYGASAQDYRARDYGSQPYGDPAYEGQGYAAYRRPQGEPGYGERRAYEPDRRDRSDFLGNNEVLRRQEDGDTDHQLWSSLGRGDHRGRGPKNYTRSDDRIREDVNDRLSDDDWLDATEIEVLVSTCEVTLNGTVNDRNDRRRAEDIAEQVSGVKHVQNNLRVDQSGAQRSGASLGTASSTQASGQTRGTGSQPG